MKIGKIEKSSPYEQSILRAVLYAVLAGGAFVVLLPLFWMILTACKHSGQALEFRFLPSSTVEGAKKTLAPPEPGTANVTFEYAPGDYPGFPAATQVSVAGEFNGWDKNRDILVKDGEVWTTVLKGLKPGRYEYKFVVNTDGWTEDKSNPNKTDEGNSLIMISEGNNSNKPLSDATRIEGEKIHFKILRPSAETLSVKVTGHDGPISLQKGDDGYFSATFPWKQKDVPQYSVLQPQSFLDGMNRIYTFSNFRKVLDNKDFPFGLFFLNSLIVAAGTAFLTVAICTLGGYVFAKKNFWFKDCLFGLLLSTMMIPGMIFMVPQFAIVNKLDWINSYQGLIVPHLANIFGLYLLKQYISTIPHSLFEAATIDGAKEWQIFKIIIIPLSFPIMVTLFLMTFVGQWGNFLWQLIVNTPDSAYRTLPVGLALFRGQYGQDWEMMMAGACFSIIPIAILFLLAQRYFIEGMTSGAVKE